MGKRSEFERIERDFYPTPFSAVLPLFEHLPFSGNFAEPCAGDGRLIKHIEDNSYLSCTLAIDIEPQCGRVSRANCLDYDFDPVDFIITNPPWDRRLLHPMIDHFIRFAPTWLLFDADWMHTLQSERFMLYCSRIVSVGRVKWIEGSKSVGKDNCAWYLFDVEDEGPTEFYGRVDYGRPRRNS